MLKSLIFTCNDPSKQIFFRFVEVSCYENNQRFYSSNKECYILSKKNRQMFAESLGNRNVVWNGCFINWSLNKCKYRTYINHMSHNMINIHLLQLGLYFCCVFSLPENSADIWCFYETAQNFTNELIGWLFV